MSFSTIQITAKGRALLARAQTGTNINFTCIKMGDGQMSGQSIDEMTDVINQKANLSVTQMKVLAGGKAKVGAVFTNTQLSVGFYWREIAVFATDPDNTSSEIMYCYGNAGALADYIPAQGSQILERLISVLTIINNATNVTATIDQSLVYASQQDLTSHTIDYSKHIPYSGATTGTANAYAINTPVITTLAEGMAISVKIHADSTGPSTLNWCGLGVKAIKKPNGNNVTNLKANGIYTLRYDGVNFTLQGEGGEYGTAIASQVLTGYTIGTDSGLVNGTMPNRAGDTACLSSSVSGTTLKLVASSGYRDGIDDTVTITDANFVEGNIKAGTNVLGKTGTFTANATAMASGILTGQTAGINGVMTTGTMPNNGAVTITPGTSNQSIALGYHNGSGVVLGDSDLVTGNIRNGTTIFNVTGTLVPLTTEKKTASGSFTTTNPSYTVNGLNFKPSKIFLSNLNTSAYPGDNNAFAFAINTNNYSSMHSCSSFTMNVDTFEFYADGFKVNRYNNSGTICGGQTVYWYAEE